MFKKILFGTIAVLGLIVITFVSVVAMQPLEFRVERSAMIAAPPSEVFPHVNDFHQWPTWSAWDKVDPGMNRTFEGPPAGEGAIYSWAGNNDVGEGKMTILESRPDELVRIELKFFKPMEGVSTAEFTFKPEGDKTHVTWAMFGPNTFLGKAIHLCLDMDKMIGDKYEESLAALKSVVEASKEK